MKAQEQGEAMFGQASWMTLLQWHHPKAETKRLRH
jgi:hypothetical protein